MTKEEFTENVAQLVAGLQVPVSLLPRGTLGAAFEPWEALMTEVTGGFGWTSVEQCREAFRKAVEK